MSSTPGHRFESTTWHSFARCRNRKPRWDHWARPLSIFVTSLITSRLGSFSAMTSRDCLAPIMSWNIALGWHGSMSGEPRVDVGLFLGWWYVVPFASSLPWQPVSRASRPRSFDPAIISAGATCVRTCSGVRKPAGNSSASAKIPLPIWLLWKLNYSREVCHSAGYLSNWRMVSGEMDSTKPNSTAFPANKRTVQWSWPVGTGLHAMAIRWAACPPVKAWRYRAWRLSCSTASNPPSRYNCRTRMEVLRLTSKVAQICWSVQPSSALSKMRARVKVRALALPAWMNVYRDARSVSDSVTGIGCCMEVLLLSHHHLTPVNIILD